MKIVHIIPGTGDVFYCQNCMRDKELVLALRKLGHDVVLVPMYLPLFTEGEDMGAPHIPVFYGAVGVYLSQKLPGFRLIPKWIRSHLDSRRLLAWVARRAGTTRATGLEEMTLSVLKGENGGQSAELDRLISWLVNHEKPDAVHLSNALLLGLAGRIKRELGVPVFCTLQDEDSWIDTMESNAARQAWTLMSEKAADVAAFIPVSEYYNRLMQSRLSGIPADRFHVIPIGINAGSYHEAQWDPERPVIGYLSRMTESLGLAFLIDAFITLRERGRVRNLRLKITGGKTPEDDPFIAGLKRKLAERNLLASVEFYPVFDRTSRREFLQSVTVLSVPMQHPEAFGMFLLEAMASGVPVVQPRFGASPEIVEVTGGGLCYEPGNSKEYVQALELLLTDESKWRQMSRAGQQAVTHQFDVGRTAVRLVRLYEQAVKSR
jgi:glycosyltransferase involved in cell wall biosynthesis